MLNEQQSEITTEEQTAQKAPVDYVFALDIGTRSVIGIVGVMQGEMLHIEAIETVEHSKRAMIDGQIEDIEQVSNVAKLVKERLEKRLGYPLQHVCVAAAGRALKTQQASFEIELKESQVIDEELISRLEAGAIGEAERRFDPKEDEENPHVFYLVGYSVVQYYLDDYPISNLLEHKGQRIRVDVIATFLPREVVDSLYTTMHKTGLDVSSLTLEPIAAINAAIPQDLRLLNLALVDIGAGTSDIAISRDGGVVGYTMATVAGDEITEAIVKAYLVNFLTAEQIKLKMGGEEDITFKDILGFEHTVTPQEVLNEIHPVMRSLCSEIAARIIEVNGAPTSAVFLVGGGSKLPGMCGCVAEFLKLDSKRVAIGGNNFTLHVDSPDYDITGPEFATPLGIAISAALNLINDSFSITLNGSKAKLFRSGRLSILDVLLMNGYSYNQLISRSGKSLMIHLNGSKKVFYGEHPVNAVITVNGAEANISTLVQAGDDVKFQPAKPGEDAHPTLDDIEKIEELSSIAFQDTDFPIGTYAEINGSPAQPGQELQNRDKVVIYHIDTLGDLARELGISDELLINGVKCPLNTKLMPGDHVTYAADAAVSSVTRGGQDTSYTAYAPQPAPVSQFVQPAVSSIPPTAVPVQPGYPALEPVPQDTPKPANLPLHITLNGTSTMLKPKAGNVPYYFVDMLNLVDIDPTKPQGEIVLQVNGKDAAYLQPLSDGDAVDIYWKKRTQL